MTWIKNCTFIFVGRRKTRRVVDSDDDSVDGDMRENKTPPKRQPSKRGAKQKPKISFDSDDESDIELFDLDKSSQSKDSLLSCTC